MPIFPRAHLLPVCTAFACQIAMADNFTTDELFDLPLAELLKLEVTTASKTEESWESSSSSITIITAADIVKSNARTVFELMRQVPGLSVEYNARNIARVNVRGIKGSPILYLLNGQSLSGVVSGGAENIAMFALPINNIKRIEIIRGPGSALYGANALVGIVNIMTFDGQGHDESEVSFEALADRDNYISSRYSLNKSHQFSGSKSINLNISVLDYNHPIYIKSDANNDAGTEEKHQQSVDLQIHSKLDTFQFFSRINTYDRGDFLGLTDYINDDGKESADSFYTNVKWQAFSGIQNKVTLSAFYDYKDVDWFWNFIPAGSNATAPGETFEDWNATGLYSNLLWKEEKIGLDILNVYTGFQSHTLVMGFASEYQRSFDIRHISNQNPNALATLSDVSSVFNWNAANNRSINALYFQDTWNINQDFNLNIGGRYDEYSDFGSTFNPRLGLTWQANERHNLKLLYGHAFRAPDFGDLYAKNLFGSNGNPDINPETINTTEVIVNSQWDDQFITTFTWFNSQLNDLIKSGNIATNQGSITSQGVESQIRYDMGNGNYLSLNHTYAYSQTDHNTNHSLPLEKGNFIFNYALDHHYNLQFDEYFQSKVQTEAAEFSGYFISNLSLVKRKMQGQFEFKASLHNLFDSQYAYSSDSLSSGYPGERRSIWLKASYEF